MCHTRNVERGKAFTLIELLVVISIIALLLAILMPVLQSVKLRAQETVCLSNEKQWGLFFGLFLSDNNDKFVDLELHRWMDMLEPYAKESPKIYCCPKITVYRGIIVEGVEKRDPFYAWKDEAGRIGSYGTNYWIREKPNPFLPPQYPAEGYWKSFGVSRASNVPVLLDCAWYAGMPLYEDPPPEEEGDISSPPDMMCMRFFSGVDRHRGAVNGLFMDLSVRRIGLKELWGLDWHRNWNPDNAPLPEWPEWMSGF